MHAEGEKDGAPATSTVEAHYDMSGVSSDEEGADTTAIPATAFLRRLVDGEIGRTGVLAPEACVEPVPFFDEVMPQLGLTLHHTVTRTDRLV